MRKLIPIAADQVAWEEAVYRAIEEKDVCRSDAQAICDGVSDLFASCWSKGMPPIEAAELIWSA